MSKENMMLDRRTFAKTSGALGALAVAGGACGATFAQTTPVAYADEAAQADEIVWTHCHVNCGGACPIKCHVRDGEVVYVESDTTGSPEFGDVQARACLRGRSIRKWLHSEDRLNYPMRRVAGTKRGDGKYERISWDEALDTIASELDRVIKTYGNEAVFIQECSGVEQNIMMNNPFFRLINLLGGEITRYGSYSSASISFGAYPYVYGGSWGNRSFKTLENDELVVMFGFAPNDMRMAGDGPGYDLLVAHEKKNVRVISIDPRRTETCANIGAEWIPIVPGTDAALVAALAHELIENDLVDIDFLHTYVVGFDEETMPEDARGKNLSYYDYVMGTGYDHVEKTPAWASAITRIPAERITALAKEIGQAKPCFICQGLGMQRHANGDNASRAVMALALMVGQVGRPGTTSVRLRHGHRLRPRREDARMGKRHHAHPRRAHHRAGEGDRPGQALLHLPRPRHAAPCQRRQRVACGHGPRAHGRPGGTSRHHVGRHHRQRQHRPEVPAHRRQPRQDEDSAVPMARGYPRRREAHRHARRHPRRRRAQDRHQVPRELRQQHDGEPKRRHQHHHRHPARREPVRVHPAVRRLLDRLKAPTRSRPASSSS